MPALGTPEARELDEMLLAIENEFAASLTPTPLRERFETFARDKKEHIDRLRATIGAAVAWWIVKGREAGHDHDILDQVALRETQAIIALVARAMKRRQGEPFSPARIAIVAYTVAKSIGEMEGPPADIKAIADTIDDLASDIEKERDRLRELIEEIADMDLGDVEIEHRTIIDRCRAEVESWDAEEVAT